MTKIEKKNATNNSTVDTATMEKFLAAKSHIGYKHNNAGGRIWYELDPQKLGDVKITKAIAAELLKNGFDLTIDEYLAAQKQWIDEQVAKSCAAVAEEIREEEMLEAAVTPEAMDIATEAEIELANVEETVSEVIAELMNDYAIQSRDLFVYNGDLREWNGSSDDDFIPYEFDGEHFASEFGAVFTFDKETGTYRKSQPDYKALAEIESRIKSLTNTATAEDDPDDDELIDEHESVIETHAYIYGAKATFAHNTMNAAIEYAKDKVQGRKGVVLEIGRYDFKTRTFKVIQTVDDKTFLPTNQKVQAVTNTPPTIDEPNDFESELAKLKAEREVAGKELAEKTAARIAAEEALRKAQEEERIAENKSYEANCAVKNLFTRKGNELTQKIWAFTPTATKLTITTQTGKNFQNNLTNISVSGSEQFGFRINCDWKDYATYDTPAQVETVINQLKAAIARGDKEFKFPTIEELTAPTNSTDDEINDSLARAMKIALEKVQEHCKRHDIKAARKEMECFSICADALHRKVVA